MFFFFQAEDGIRDYKVTGVQTCALRSTVCIHTENQNQVSFYPFVPHEISVLIELTLGHLCYLFTDVPPQPNSPPDVVSHVGQQPERPS